MSVTQISPFDREAFNGTLSFFSKLALLSEPESGQILSLLDEDFEFAQVIRFAESVHVHVEVDSVKDLPDEKIRQQSGVVSIDRYQEPDMVKYSYDGGINVIFSAFPISQDDLVPGGAGLSKPFVDHLGIDLRDGSAATRAIFDAIPGRASEVGWRHVHQAAPLYCCYTACSEKHWVFPPLDARRGYRPIEFAFGSLRKFDTNMGCDYRPIDPAHPLAGTLPTRSTGCS
jgi:hypothetical protein